MDASTIPETGCCPRFDPEPWEGRTFTWENKAFVRATVPQFMHIPLPGAFGRAVRNLWKTLEEGGARPEDRDFIMLSSETSPWKGELLITATKPVAGADNEAVSGTFATKVFDGGFNEVPSWIRTMDGWLAGEGRKAQKYYFYYTTCPKCAKVYGHNYVVAFARVD